MPDQNLTDSRGMIRIYDFESLLAEVVKDCAEEMNKIQPQDLTFIPDVVYLEHDNET